MKKLLSQTLLTACAAMLLSGCIGLSMGGGSKTESHNATLGQQLMDLKQAKDSGAISESEYQEQKAKLLANKQ